MIGKALAISATIYGIKKLGDMDADELRAIGAKVSAGVGAVYGQVTEMAEESEAVAEIAEKIRSTEYGGIFLDSVNEFAGPAAGKLSDGAEALFGTMADAKEAAEKGDGTFLTNTAKGVFNGLMDGISEDAVYEAEGSGSDYGKEDGEQAYQAGDASVEGPDDEIECGA